MDAIGHLNSVIGDRYAVEREIGRGGMATVYLARDLRHRRQVALKVLNPELRASLGADRFLSEITVTAGLHHPNLLPLFDSGEADGRLYYVMPYVAGESLRARLTREKLLPIDEAVHIGNVIASALDYAHRHGVIHRDLKPENILLQEGEPLVADFGIALAVSLASNDRITQSGLTLGTPQYMSPEQATGERTIDARSDIYSLAAVVYEMLTGEPPHSGATVHAVIARVISETPRPVRTVRELVPEHVELAVGRALAKLPADRFATAREFATALTGRQEIRLAGGRGMLPAAGKVIRDGAADATPVGQPGGSARLRQALPWAAAFLGIVAAGAGGRWIAVTGDTRGPVRAPFEFQGGLTLASVYGPLALSPDGRLVAYTAEGSEGRPRLFVQSVGDRLARELPGTNGAAQLSFSPDGKWVGFYVAPLLKKVAVTGGTPVTISELPTMVGASWTPDGEQIVVSTDGRLGIVPASGGAVRLLTKPDSSIGEWRQVTPLVLADGRTVLYASRKAFVGDSRIGVMSLRGGPVKVLDVRGTSPLAVVDGNLVYVSVDDGLRTANSVMKIRFDERRQRVNGEPVLVSEGAHIHGTGIATASVSRSGSLIYLNRDEPRSQVVLARPGAPPTILLADPMPYYSPRFAPDGNRFALSTFDKPEWRLDVFDLQSGTLSPIPLLEVDSGRYPEWMPDGIHVLYSLHNKWMQRPADLSAPEELVHPQGDSVSFSEAVVSRDGRMIVGRVNLGNRTRDLWYRQLSGDTSLKPLVQDPASEFGPRISPDGRWVAYWSEDARPEGLQTYVNITALPGPGPRHRVSSVGGRMPVWSADGRRLFYVQRGKLLVASLTFEPELAVTATDTVFREGFDFEPTLYHANYDVSHDGRFVFPKRVGAPSKVILMHDWKYGLREGAGTAPP